MSKPIHHLSAERSEAEATVIAGIIQVPERAAAAFAIANAGMFSDDCHATAARALADMVATGEEIGPLSLNARLRDQRSFQGYSPRQYLADIAVFVPAAELTAAAHTIHDAYRRRRLQKLAAYIDGVAGGSGSIDDCLVDATAECDTLSRDGAQAEPRSADAFEDWATSVISRTKPATFDWIPSWNPLSRFQIGRGRVDVIAAPPACGKTLFVSQVVFDALRQEGQEDLRLLSVNVEMGVPAQCDRQLARLTGVGASFIRDRTYDADAVPRVQAGIEALRDLMPRIEFMRPPFTLERVVARANAFAADIIVLDYIQRLDTEARSGDQRTQCGVAMDVCRRLADEDRAVIAISAVNRTGYAKESAGLASFRESSELEYGADSAWLMHREEAPSRSSSLKAVKMRHGELTEIRMVFDGANQQFTEDRSELEWNPE